MENEAELQAGGTGAGEVNLPIAEPPNGGQQEVNTPELDVNGTLLMLANAMQRLDGNVNVLAQQVDRLQGARAPPVQQLPPYQDPTTMQDPFSDFSKEERTGCCAKDTDFVEFCKKNLPLVSDQRAKAWLEFRVQFYSLASLSDYNTARLACNVANDSAVHPVFMARLRQVGWNGVSRAASSPGATSTRKTGVCFTCGGEGHWARDCPNKKANLKAGPAPEAGKDE